MSPPAESADDFDAAEVRRGILWMLLAMLAFPSMDAIAKHLAQSYPVVMIVWARYIFAVGMIAFIVRPRRWGPVPAARPGLQILRGLLVLVSAVLFFAGLRFIPLADATALVITAPILVTALAIPLLHEKVAVRRWLGMIAGVAGAMIIVRPGAGAMQWAALLPLGAAFLFALHQIMARILGRTDEVTTTLAYTTVVGVLLSSAALPFFWVTPTFGDWALMAALSFFSICGQFAIIKAFKSAPATTVTPFTMTNLIWATLFGFAIFGDLPDRWTILGMAIIVTSCLYVQHRRRVRGQDGTDETEADSQGNGLR